MKSLPTMMIASMLSCFVSVPIGCLIASLCASLLFFDGKMGLQVLRDLWIMSSIVGFPFAFFYGAPLYAVCVRYYRPAWWLVLLMGGGPFLPFALHDLTDRFSGDALLFLSYGISVAVSHHLLWSLSPTTVEGLQTVEVPAPPDR